MGSKIFKFIILAFYFLITSPLWELTFKLVEISQELNSIIFFLISFLSLSFFPFLLFLFHKYKKEKIRRILGTVIGIIFFSYISLVYISDSEIGTTDRVKSILVNGNRISKFLPFNFLSEKDQLLLGGYFLSKVDSKFSGKFAQEFLTSIDDVYREMANDGSFDNLGSQLVYFYLDVLGLGIDNLQIYYYVPKKVLEKNQKIPLLIFFHGAFGNWKSYLWVWKKFADEHGFAIVCPSFGNGRWDLPQGRLNIKRTLDWIIKDKSFDLNKILVAGLSNGGIGASIVIRDFKNDLSINGLVLISPVIPDLVKSDSFINNAKNLPFFIISGKEDKRIAISKIEERVTFFRKEGLDVEFVTIPDQDHYLILTKRNELVQNVSKWYFENSRGK